MYAYTLHIGTPSLSEILRFSLTASFSRRLPAVYPTAVMSGLSLSPPPTRTSPSFVDLSTTLVVGHLEDHQWPGDLEQQHIVGTALVQSSSFSPPRRTRSRVRSTDSTRDDAESDSNVYLIPEWASGVAAAPQSSNVHAIDGPSRWQRCSVNDLGTSGGLSCSKWAAAPPANSPRPPFLRPVCSERSPLYTFDEFGVRVQVGRDATEPQQCQCLAHTALFDSDLSEDKWEDLKSLIRSPHMIHTLDEGNEFVIALLKRLIHLFGMLDIRVSPAGRGQGVSYVLLHKNKRYHFAGHPDFVMYKDNFGVQRIIICTGEVQSTSDPDTQNSIYAIGTMLPDRSDEDTTPVLCIMLFKGKYCTLALARLNRYPKLLGQCQWSTLFRRRPLISGLTWKLSQLDYTLYWNLLNTSLLYSWLVSSPDPAQVFVPIRFIPCGLHVIITWHCTHVGIWGSSPDPILEGGKRVWWRLWLWAVFLVWPAPCVRADMAALEIHLFSYSMLCKLGCMKLILYHCLVLD